MRKETKIPGACMCHKIISDECRANRGDLPAALAAIGDAERSLREGIVNLGHAKGFRFHVVVTCERPPLDLDLERRLDAALGPEDDLARIAELKGELVAASRLIANRNEEVDALNTRLRRTDEDTQRLRLCIAKLHDATIILRNGMGGHGHWDETMRRGEGCPICIQQREALARADALLDEVSECVAPGSTHSGAGIHGVPLE